MVGLDRNEATKPEEEAPRPRRTDLSCTFSPGPAPRPGQVFLSKERSRISHEDHIWPQDVRKLVRPGRRSGYGDFCRSSASIAASIPKPTGSKTSLMNLRPTKRIAFRWALMSFTSVILCAMLSSRTPMRRLQSSGKHHCDRPGRRGRELARDPRRISATTDLADAEHIPGHRPRVNHARGPITRLDTFPSQSPLSASPVADRESYLNLSPPPRVTLSDACLCLSDPCSLE